MLRDIFIISVIGALIMIWVLFLVMSSWVTDDPALPVEEQMTSEDLEYIGLVFSLMSIAQVGFLAWRYRLWSRLLSNGIELRGRVVDIETEGEIVSLKIAYTCEGQEITTTKTISGLLPLYKKKISIGEEVRVLVNTKKPDRYLMLNYFFKHQA
ncbi:MAG: hypothetical protein KKE24_04505 [Candidatus Thermoplasmatota archaeon]|nr:hypothetical protein [Candidatus Thermoplasmatota archaeon]